MDSRAGPVAVKIEIERVDSVSSNRYKNILFLVLHYYSVGNNKINSAWVYSLCLLAFCILHNECVSAECD